MCEIRYRLAKRSDAAEIADVHWHVRDRYTQGIFLSLGKSFLKSYYKIILDDPWEVVVCAVNGSGKIIGFTSVSMDALSRFRNIRKHKFSLGLAALKSLMLSPSLLKGLWLRYRSLSDKVSPEHQFVHTEGARGGYWCWSKEDDSMKSIELLRKKDEILKQLGIKEIYFEVDKFNKAVYRFHLTVNKAEPLNEITLPDGRVRVLMRKQI